MKCPVCGDGKSRVVDSRDRGTWRYRRHECPGCGHRWTTQEIPSAELEPLVQLRDLAERLRGVL